jgi:hypothetical protein
MPAITLARLRQQAALVVGNFDEPAAFVRSLHHLLEFYADRTQRPGQAGEPPPLLASYRVPPPVLRQILLELMPWAREQPEDALELCDALWAVEYLEFRLLAASLLGTIPTDTPHPILQRVETWCSTEAEERLIRALLNEGLSRLQKEQPEQILDKVETWLEDREVEKQKLGLRALIPILNRREYEDLPMFFRLLGPLVRNIPDKLRHDLLDALNALARRSPRETAYFLRQMAEIPNSPDAAWLIRQCLDEFPVDIQPGLRSAAREVEKQRE